MTDKCFVDTNIWLYAHLAAPGDTKHGAAAKLVRNPVTISNQVVHEYYAAMLKTQADDGLIQDNIRLMLIHCDLFCLSIFTLHTAFAIKNKYAVSWWDSLIVAAALESKCKILYTEDLQDGQEIDGLTIRNPFTG